jgi:L-fucose isomerase-like protein
LTASRLTRPLRIGLLTPYFSFFDKKFPASFRTSQESYAGELAAALGGKRTTVIPSGLVDSPETAAQAEALFRQERTDVVVVAPLMAAPPGFVTPMLASLQQPVVIWLDDRTDVVEAAISELDATRYSSLLGSIMLTSSLRAADVRYYVVATKYRDSDPVVRAARGAAVKPMLAQLRLGVLGEPIPGYSDVLLSAEAARAMGVSVVRLEPSILSPSYASGGAPLFSPANADAWEIKADAQATLPRSLALGHDLRRAVEQQDLDVLVINCHSDQLRFHPERGIVGCLGASALTSSGYPVSCTGDAATGVALAIATWLGGQAQYCEGYVVGRDDGQLLISSCGLANVELREASQPLEIHGNDLYPGACGNGCCIRMGFAAGPATILALAGNSSSLPPRFIWKTGTMSGRYFEHMNGPSGTFSFDPPGGRSTSATWVDAGPSHHLALSRGCLDAELTAAAAFVNADFVAVASDPVNT